MHRYQDTVALSSCDVEHIGRCRLRAHSVNLYDLHGMTFKPEVLSRKRGHVDDSEPVGLSGLDTDRSILRVIHQGRIRYWLRSGRVAYADERLQ